MSRTYADPMTVGTARVITRRHRSGKAKTRRTMSAYQRRALAQGYTVLADEGTVFTRDPGSYAE